MNLLIKSRYGYVPEYAYPGDAGLDLRVIRDVSLEPGESQTVSTGISAAVPDGCVGLVFPRSGLGSKGITLRNAVGVIDSGYRGEIKVALWNTTDERALIEYGTRVAQLVIVPYVRCDVKQVRHFPHETERGEKGHGSSGIE